MVELTRPPVDLDVAEAVEGERRLELVLAAAQDEAVGCLGGSQRPGAQLVVLEHLGVPQRDRRYRPGPGPEPQPADQVLPEIDQRPASRRRPDLDWLQLLLPPDGRTDVRGQRG